jgi:hypothetical protein
MKTLAEIQKNYDKKDCSKATIVIEAINFMHQMDILMTAGYKLAIVDPEGNQHFISKKSPSPNQGEEEDDDNKNKEQDWNDNDDELYGQD